jgi:ABC transporter substrate binding protein
MDGRELTAVVQQWLAEAAKPYCELCRKAFGRRLSRRANLLLAVSYAFSRCAARLDELAAVRHRARQIPDAGPPGAPWRWSTAVVDGGLASYSPDFREGGRLSATYVRRILEGSHAGDLPVEQMDKLIFVINLKTAKQIGLVIPESILIRADQVIE